MNRIFHARIAWYQYFLIAILGANAFGFLWCKHILLALILMLLLIVVIEQVIHTAYTLTADGELILSYGRFIRKRIIPIAHITAVKQCSSMKFGSFAVTRYVLIEYGKAKYATALPVKEQEFIELIEKRRNLKNQEK